MLIVTFKDANNTLVHLATVICDKENCDNFSWMYRLMKKNPEMAAALDSDKTTIFTDGHSSHGPALRTHAKDAFWRLCLKHLIGRLTQQVGQVRGSISACVRLCSP